MAFDFKGNVKNTYNLSVWLLLDFFCSGILLYVLLSLFLCFISILYLDLYVFKDDASIS